MASYDAFISYSQRVERPLVVALQREMEGLGRPRYRRRTLRVFRDNANLGASAGLGYLLVDGQQTGRPAVIISSIALFALLGKLTDWALASTGRRLTHWQDGFAPTGVQNPQAASSNETDTHC